MNSATNDFKEAVELGKSILSEITLGGKPPPEFLPRARGLIFYSTTRAGLGIGIEHGRGFILSRLPYSAASEYHENWSPPWFIKISGLECGAIIGVEKISALVGIMSERALKELTTAGSKIALGSDYSIYMAYGTPSKRKHKHPEVMFDSDLCCAAVSAAGMMVDIGLSGTVFHRDVERITRCYGSEVKPSQVLGGGVPPAPEMEDLEVVIWNASRAARVAAFEPSNTADEGDESGY